MTTLFNYSVFAFNFRKKILMSQPTQVGLEVKTLFQLNLIHALVRQNGKTGGSFDLISSMNSMLGISWLTVSNQIVKSLSSCYKKSYFFNMVQLIDLIFCKVIEMIEQNIFNRVDFSFRS